MGEMSNFCMELRETRYYISRNWAYNCDLDAKITQIVQSAIYIENLRRDIYVYVCVRDAIVNLPNAPVAYLDLWALVCFVE